MPEKPLVIFTEDGTLPDNTDQKEQCIADIKSAMANVFRDYGITSDRLDTYVGDIYSQVDDVCPNCHNPLKLQNPELDTENGAYASATCSCGYAGEGVYRLIDVEEFPDEESESAIANSTSAVNEESLSVTYLPYTETVAYRD